MSNQFTRRDFLKISAASSFSLAGGCSALGGFKSRQDIHADMILTNGRITTLDKLRPQVSAIAIKDGNFLAVGTEKEVMAYRGSTF